MAWQPAQRLHRRQGWVRSIDAVARSWDGVVIEIRLHHSKRGRLQGFVVSEPSPAPRGEGPRSTGLRLRSAGLFHLFLRFSSRYSNPPVNWCSAVAGYGRAEIETCLSARRCAVTGEPTQCCCRASSHRRRRGAGARQESSIDTMTRRAPHRHRPGRWQCELVSAVDDKVALRALIVKAMKSQFPRQRRADDHTPTCLPRKPWIMEPGPRLCPRASCD